MRTAERGDPVYATRRRLVVIGFRLTRAGHWYNELLGYASAARNLGWKISILVPKSAGKDMRPSLSRQNSMEALRAVSPCSPHLSRVDWRSRPFH